MWGIKPVSVNPKHRQTLVNNPISQPLLPLFQLSIDTNHYKEGQGNRKPWFKMFLMDKEQS